MLVRPVQTTLPRRHKEVYSLDEEPPNLRGLLFLQRKDSTVEVLRYSGESEPTGPPDIPPEAVTEHGVFISVDGIGQDWGRHREQIRDWFHGGVEYGFELPGPVVGIHEGEGKNTLSDGARILRNTVYTKRLQCDPSLDLRAKIYANDPSVKTIHDQLAQSLRAGRQVTLMTHSGGAAQVALALTLMAADQSEDWKPAIADKVRVLGMAPAAHRKDFELAGVEPSNIMMTGSRKDPVYRFYRNFLNPRRPSSLLRFLVDGVSASVKFALSPGPYHQGEYIFPQNEGPGGNRLEEFVLGSPGVDRPLP